MYFCWELSFRIMKYVWVDIKKERMLFFKSVWYNLGKVR